jgi:Na+/melibiose symporter-like transporter
LCGVLLAAVLPNVLSSDLRHGVAYLSWVFIPLLFFATLLAICWVPQGRHQHASSKHSNLPAQQAIWQVWRAPAFVRLVGVYAINGIAAAIPATLVLFFINDVLHAESWSGVFLMLYFAAAAVALPLWVRLADSYGRVSTWLLAMALACASFAAVPWLGPGDVFAFATICIASGVALGADLVLPPALLAEHVAEHGNAGGNFGWWTAVTKLNLAVAAGISLPLLSALGYAPGTSGDGVRALAWLYGGLPLLLKLFAGVLLWRSRLYLQKLTQGVHA